MINPTWPPPAFICNIQSQYRGNPEKRINRSNSKTPWFLCSHPRPGGNVDSSDFFATSSFITHVLHGNIFDRKGKEAQTAAPALYNISLIHFTPSSETFQFRLKGTASSPPERPPRPSAEWIKFLFLPTFDELLSTTLFPKPFRPRKISQAFLEIDKCETATISLTSKTFSVVSCQESHVPTQKGKYYLENPI